MEQRQQRAAVPTGGKYYPRKMAHGWCVAHPVTVCGTTIERFGAKYRTYGEAFKAAAGLNTEETATQSPVTPSAADAAEGSTEGRLPESRKEVRS